MCIALSSPRAVPTSIRLLGWNNLIPLDCTTTSELHRERECVCEFDCVLLCTSEEIVHATNDRHLLNRAYKTRLWVLKEEGTGKRLDRPGEYA